MITVIPTPSEVDQGSAEDSDVAALERAAIADVSTSKTIRAASVRLQVAEVELKCAEVMFGEPRPESKYWILDLSSYEWSVTDRVQAQLAKSGWYGFMSVRLGLASDDIFTKQQTLHIWRPDEALEQLQTSLNDFNRWMEEVDELGMHNSRLTDLVRRKQTRKKLDASAEAFEKTWPALGITCYDEHDKVGCSLFMGADNQLSAVKAQFERNIAKAQRLCDSMQSNSPDVQPHTTHLSEPGRTAAPVVPPQAPGPVAQKYIDRLPQQFEEAKAAG